MITQQLSFKEEINFGEMSFAIFFLLLLGFKYSVSEQE